MEEELKEIYDLDDNDRWKYLYDYYTLERGLSDDISQEKNKNNAKSSINMLKIGSWKLQKLLKFPFSNP